MQRQATTHRRGLPRAVRAWLIGFSVAMPVACGGEGGSTGPPPSAPGADDPAALQSAAGRAAEASAEFERQVAGGNADPVGALVASLQADPNVAKVERLDDSGTVIARLQNSAPLGVLVAEQNRTEWTAGSPGGAPGVLRGAVTKSAGLSAQTASSPITCDSSNYPRSKKACVFRTIDFELFGGEDDIELALKRANFEVTTGFVPTRAEEIVQFQQTLSTCGVLYISAHGGVTENVADTRGNHILTDIVIGEPGNISREKFLEQLRVLGPAFGQNFERFFGTAAQGGKSYLTLSPEFFASVQYPNTLVFTNACATDAPAAGGTQLRDAFRKHGAGAFLGWKTQIASALANPAAVEIFNALAPEPVAIDGVRVTISPPKPDPGQSYVPSAGVSPPQAGVEISLTIRGTDGFQRDTTAITDLLGEVTFAPVPGGQGNVIDSITVVAGGAGSSATAVNAVVNSPTLQKSYVLPWFAGGISVNALTLDAKSTDFNLVCNNAKLTQELEVVKF